MYINAKVVDRQFELIISRLDFSFPQISPGKGISVGVFYFHYSVQTPVFYIQSQERSVTYAAEGGDSIILSTLLSLPAALDISHQSRPNRGGAC